MVVREGLLVEVGMGFLRLNNFPGGNGECVMGRESKREQNEFQGRETVDIQSLKKHKLVSYQKFKQICFSKL